LVQNPANITRRTKKNQSDLNIEVGVRVGFTCWATYLQVGSSAKVRFKVRKAHRGEGIGSGGGGPLRGCSVIAPKTINHSDSRTGALIVVKRLRPQDGIHLEDLQLGLTNPKLNKKRRGTMGTHRRGYSKTKKKMI